MKLSQVQNETEPEPPGTESAQTDLSGQALFTESPQLSLTQGDLSHRAPDYLSSTFRALLCVASCYLERTS